MQRIAVLGCSGAGKTTLARRLGERLGLPVVHGDFLGRRGEDRAHGEEWRRLEGGVLEQDAWILDAMRLSSLDARLARADTAIFLDLPRATCVASVLRRRLADRGAAARVSWDFVRWIWRFPQVERPQILELLALHEGSTRIVVLRDRASARRFVEGFPPLALPRP